MLSAFTLAGGNSLPPPAWSYWVVENHLLAGSYPGSPDQSQHHQRITSLIDAGIRTFINLMEVTETDSACRSFASYEQIADQLAAPQGAKCVRSAIRDLSIPQPECMTRILDCIDASLAERLPVYVHCWGGVVRTGTVIGCWLMRHGLATRDAVLSTLARLRKCDAERGHRISPETDAQQQFVLGWAGV